jgi:hypothetical protein
VRKGKHADRAGPSGSWQDDLPSLRRFGAETRMDGWFRPLVNSTNHPSCAWKRTVLRTDPDPPRGRALEGARGGGMVGWSSTLGSRPTIRLARASHPGEVTSPCPAELATRRRRANRDPLRPRPAGKPCS